VGTKCVLTIPLVVQPQMKNVAASSQNGRLFIASESTLTARRAAPWVGESSVTVRSAPYGRRPTSEGRSRITNRTRGMSRRVIAQMISDALRQP
jgi:hypothetical protein